MSSCDNQDTPYIFLRNSAICHNVKGVWSALPICLSWKLCCFLLEIIVLNIDQFIFIVFRQLLSNCSAASNLKSISFHKEVTPMFWSSILFSSSNPDFFAISLALWHITLVEIPKLLGFSLWPNTLVLSPVPENVPHHDGYTRFILGVFVNFSLWARHLQTQLSSTENFFPAAWLPWSMA